jgi:hypothetical protein
MRKQSKSPEHWASEVFGDILTKGNMDIIKNLWHLFTKLNASTALVFFRYRMGTKFMNGATLFWGYVVMTLCWMIEQTARVDIGLTTGKAPEGKSSMVLFVLTIIAFGIVGVYHLFESRRNLRRTDGRGKPRYSADGGLSILWTPFSRLLEPFGLLPAHGERVRWWQLNEFKFQKFIEPLLIVLIGLLFRQLGYGYFGSYIIIAGYSAFMLLVHLEDNYFEKKQEMWDAQVLSSVVQERDHPTERLEGVVVQQAIIRSDADFEGWHTAYRNESRFETSENHLQAQPA